MGIISWYLDYEELLLKIRYLSKNWLLFTQKYLNYLNTRDQDLKNNKFHKIAKMKVIIDEMYSGKVVIPIIWHPYYSEAEELSLFYEWSFRGEKHKESYLYLRLFFHDLFKSEKHFKNLK